jgi:hypothetical protein
MKPMAEEIESTRSRIERLERQVRVPQSVTAIAIVLIVWVAVMPRSLAQQSVDTMRVRQLVVEDGEMVPWAWGSTLPLELEMTLTESASTWLRTRKAVPTSVS